MSVFLNIFFDVDFTIVDGDGELRPGVRELLEELGEQGHAVYLWSGIGPRWEVVEDHGLEHLVRGCYEKPLYRHREMLEPLGIPVVPDFVVDDHPHLVHTFGGRVVRPYRRRNDRDRDMEGVSTAIERSIRSLQSRARRGGGRSRPPGRSPTSSGAG